MRVMILKRTVNVGLRADPLNEANIIGLGWTKLIQYEEMNLEKSFQSVS